MRGKVLQKTTKGLTILALLLLLTTPIILAQEETPTPYPQYYSVETLTLPDGTSIDRVVISGPPEPPPGFEHERAAAPGQVAAAGTLPVPAYDWSYGCSATSAAMIAAYYDRTDYPNMYTGPTGGGVMPMDNSVWGSNSWINCDPPPATTIVWECPLSATRNGVDGRVTNGHVDDYWIGYACGGPDPFETNGWTEHTHGDCTGDYMKTNQDAYGNSDGSTTFYYYTNGAPIYASDLEGYGVHVYDGGYGFKLFYESRGYTVVTMYNQYRLGYNGVAQGFTYGQYKAEIDAGRPVMIHIEGHTMVGVGYDDSSSDLMYINDTWDFLSGVHTMTWGGSYSGMPHMGVTVVQLAPVTYGSVATGGWDTGSTWDANHVPGPSGVVTVNTGHTVTLGSDAEAYDLTIESGAALDLADYDLTVGGTMTNTGTLSQTLNVPSGSGTEFLHIQNVSGSADKYLGVSITPSTGSMGSTSVAIRGNQQCTTGEATDPTVDRCFEIVPGSSQTAAIRFYYLDGELDGLDASAMQAWHWNTGTSSWEQAGSSWTRNPGTPYNWCEASGVNQYSFFVLRGGDAPTAITLHTVAAQAARPLTAPLVLLALGIGGLALMLLRRTRRRT